MHVAPENIVLVVVFAGLTAYALLGGADFGAGVWQVNTAMLAPEKERQLLFKAIGPVWEANHVWLIFVLVAMFGAFPEAFAAVCQSLWLPLLLALGGIVLRGVGFAFRSYAVAGAPQLLAWETLFAVGSTMAPFFLGACVGAIASGRLALAGDGQFDGNYATGWLSPMALFTGFFVVVMCVYLAAVYLVREAWQSGDAQLLELWRRRALATGIWTGALALVGLGYVATDTPPHLWEGFRDRSWPLVVGSIAAGGVTQFALLKGYFRLAVVAAATAVSTVIWGWAAAQYPYLVPPTVTIESAKAPENILRLLIITIAAGSLLLVPAILYLFYLFKSGQPSDPRKGSPVTAASGSTRPGKDQPR